LAYNNGTSPKASAGIRKRGRKTFRNRSRLFFKNKSTGLVLLSESVKNCCSAYAEKQRNFECNQYRFKSKL